MTLTGIGQLKQHTQRPEEGARAFREAITIFDATLGETHPSTATARHTFAGFLLDERDHAAAEAEFRRALDVFRSADVEPTNRVVVILHDLAELYLTTGDPLAAEAHYLEADSIGRAAYGGPHPYLALGWHGLGRLAHDRGDHAAAAAYDREAIAIGEQVLRSDHPYLARFREALAHALAARVTPASPLLSALRPAACGSARKVAAAGYRAASHGRG